MWAPVSIKKIPTYINANVYTRHLIQMHWILGKQQLLVSSYGNTSLLFSMITCTKHTHTTIQYVSRSSDAAAGRTQEEQKRKQREGGKQTGILYISLMWVALL